MLDDIALRLRLGFPVAPSGSLLRRLREDFSPLSRSSCLSRYRLRIDEARTEQRETSVQRRIGCVDREEIVSACPFGFPGAMSTGRTRARLLG